MSSDCTDTHDYVLMGNGQKQCFQCGEIQFMSESEKKRIAIEKKTPNPACLHGDHCRGRGVNCGPDFKEKA